MKRLAFLTALFFAALPSLAQQPETTPPKQGRAPEKIFGAAIVHDPIHTSETVAHFIARAQEIAQKAQMIQHQIKNLKGPDRWLKRDAANVFHEVNDVLVQRQAIVFPRDDLEEAWTETFQTFEPVDPALYPHGADDLGRQRVERTIDTLWGVMRATRHHTVRLNDGQRLLEQIKDAAEGAGGNLDATQYQNQLQTFAAEEIAGVRHLLAVQLNALIVKSMFRIVTDAQAAYALDRWIRDDVRPLTGFRGAGDF
ncbi:MAG: hypothetical protein D6696_15385 [Acidobacteria bacterium]|nr:MAG: hypothetical protein D6696_15385 [Acidobacteriota bacterium]